MCRVTPHVDSARQLNGSNALIDQLGKEFGRDEESAPVYIGYSSGLGCDDFIEGLSWLLQCRRFVAGTDQQVAKFSKLDFVAGVEDFCVSEMDGDIGVGVLIRTQSRCKGFTTSLGSAVLGQRFRQRQPHLKTCVAGFRGDLNISRCLSQFAERCRGRALCLPDSLRGEEWFENVRLYFGQDTRTVIGDLDHNTTVLAIGSHSKLAFTTHGINGIVDDICPDLVQFAPE